MFNYNVVMKHSGVPGMHWGQRRARWYPISAYEDHLRRMGYSNHKIKRKVKQAEKAEAKYQKKVAKTRSKNLAKASQARKASLEKKREKEDIIRTGDLERASKRMDDFSNEELRVIVERNQAKINLSKARTDAMLSKMGTIADVTQKVSNITTNGINIYNNVAKIANIFGDTELPIINNGGNNNTNNNSNNSNSSNNSNKQTQQTSQNNQNNSDNNQRVNDKAQAKRDKQINKDIEKRIKDLDKATRKNAERAEKERKTAEREKEPERYSGDVEGEPKYSKKTYEKAEQRVKDIIVDAVWEDITNSDIRKGEQYVQNALPYMNYPLLEMKR